MACKYEDTCKDYPLCRGCGKYKKTTNADRIRAMSDEELARIFTNFFVTVAEANNIPVVLDDNFESDHLDFLKEPAEEKT